MMSATLTKKKRIRGGHRASVTKMLSQVDEILDSLKLGFDDASALKLVQQKSALAGKIEVLSRLDEEIVELIENEDDLEQEIIGADTTREKIDITILSIDSALESLKCERPRELRRVQSSVSVLQQRVESGATAGVHVPVCPERDNLEPVLCDPCTSKQPLESDRVPEHGLEPSLNHVTRNLQGLYTTDVYNTNMSTNGLSAPPVLNQVYPPGAPPQITLAPPIVIDPPNVAKEKTLAQPVDKSISELPTAHPMMSQTHPPVIQPAVPSLIVDPCHRSQRSMPPCCGELPVQEIPVLPPVTVPNSNGMLGPHWQPLPSVVSSIDVANGSFTTHRPSPNTLAGPRVKLPKLTLKRFNGDLTKWTTFWDCFNASIHSNPTLSTIDKFSYLSSLLESTAADAISGLTLTVANYEEAIAILKRRFGNQQLIVNRHMDLLLNMSTVTSHSDLKGLRHFYDCVESNVRGLKAMGVSVNSYGGLLISIILNKLPSDVRLLVSRQFTEDTWNADKLMRLLEEEIEARERAVAGSNSVSSKKPQTNRLPTTATFVAGSTSVKCVYCGGAHLTTSCTVVIGSDTRKGILKKSGRCFVCLRKYHTSKQCRSKSHCSKCKGRHHITICPSGISQAVQHKDLPSKMTAQDDAATTMSHSSSTLYVDSNTSVLLQTAKFEVQNPSIVDDVPHSPVMVRAIFDCGSQRSYITDRVKNSLQLLTKRTENIYIKTFGSSVGDIKRCEVVELCVVARNGSKIYIETLVVPMICDPLNSQSISDVQECYDHLVDLDLADGDDMDTTFQIDVLIGSDNYWELITGKVKRGKDGPMALETKVGWILSGPTGFKTSSVNLNLTSTHALKVDTCVSNSKLDNQLKRFWELESLGIEKENLYEVFAQRMSFKNHHYEVGLPWKENHPSLPTNHNLCKRRLAGLHKKLKANPQLMSEYNSIIASQLKEGIIEIVENPEESTSDKLHYLPHHPVIRKDRLTSKVRIVYDASARQNGPSLNNCLYTGPNLTQSIFDILLRFRTFKIALGGDIEKAFLQVSIEEKDRDSLRFLWFKDIHQDPTEVEVLRFTRVVFGVTASPFLLNATIHHHMEKYREQDPSFVKLFLSSIYVDDVSIGAEDVNSTFQLYLKSKIRLLEAGFHLRKFVTNSEELRTHIKTLEDQENLAGRGNLTEMSNVDKEISVEEEDQSYAKQSLGSEGQEKQSVKILGIQWNFKEDSFIFDMRFIGLELKKAEPTKRNIVSIATRLYDPLGIMSPVTVLFKLLFQDLCQAKVEWDDRLTGNHLSKWNHLTISLSSSKLVTVHRYCCNVGGCYKLIGYCDASTRAYAAVVYLRSQSQDDVTVELIASKTRVSPNSVKLTIPRLELLAALLLSKLIVSIQKALVSEMTIDELICYTDSKVVFHWIHGSDRKQWKQFVESRVLKIVQAVPARCWRHCSGSTNPADIPSRGMLPNELVNNPIWFNGPEWLLDGIEDIQDPKNVDVELSNDVLLELKQSSLNSTGLLVVNNADCDSSVLMNYNNYSSLNKLLRVTALVIKFVQVTKLRTWKLDSYPSDRDIRSGALRYWIKENQRDLLKEGNFKLWKQQFGLFIDDAGIWRCNGRLMNSDLPCEAHTPILLNKEHHLTKLIILNAHDRVLHNGVAETLNEIRTRYWLIRGRQMVRKVLSSCTICRRYEGQPYQAILPPPLPDFRVQQSHPFEVTGVDFAGPLYTKTTTATTESKVWLCLYTCCSSRAIHLEIVPNLSAPTFIQSFRRFSARRGLPRRMISDNGKTFKLATKLINSLLTVVMLRNILRD